MSRLEDLEQEQSDPNNWLWAHIMPVRAVLPRYVARVCRLLSGKLDSRVVIPVVNNFICLTTASGTTMFPNPKCL